MFVPGPDTWDGFPRRPIEGGAAVADRELCQAGVAVPP